MAMMKRQASIDGAHWVEYYEGDDLSGYKYKRKDNGNGWDVFHVDGRPFHGAGVAMSTSERPVPAVGQVWRRDGQEFTIHSIDTGSNRVRTCKPGTLDDDGFKHLGEDCCWYSVEALCEGGTFIRHAPTPITGILTANGSTPEAKPPQGRSSLVGSRWQGANDCFTVTADDCHGDCTMVELAWDDGSLGAYAIARLHVDFTRIQPTTSVGSGSAKDGECGDVIVNELKCQRIPGHLGFHRHITADGMRYMGAFVAKPADFHGPAIVPDLKALVAKPEARPAYVAPPVTFGASADSWSPAKPKPQRATYASLLAALEAEEGVVPPLKCQECGKLGARIGKRGKGMPDRQLCRECHIEADAQVLMLMKRPMFYQAPAETAAEPYQPSCDPDFDIPYSWELP